MLIKTSRKFDGIIALVLIAASIIAFAVGRLLERHGVDTSPLEYVLLLTSVFGITFAVRWLNKVARPD
jgi:hypothetical protein